MYKKPMAPKAPLAPRGRGLGPKAPMAGKPVSPKAGMKGRGAGMIPPAGRTGPRQTLN